MTLTTDDWLKAGISKDDWLKAGLSEEEAAQSAGVYTMIFDAGQLTILTNGEPAFEASYTVFRDQLEAQEAEDYKIVAHWSLNGDMLSFSDISVPGGDATIETVVWTSHPWTRVN
jgi:hypothetical protein